jgi:hypothetical protein
MDASPFELEFRHSWQSQGGALISDLPINLEDDGLMLLDFGSDVLEGDFDTNLWFAEARRNGVDTGIFR